MNQRAQYSAAALLTETVHCVLLLAANHPQGFTDWKQHDSAEHNVGRQLARRVRPLCMGGRGGAVTDSPQQDNQN